MKKKTRKFSLVGSVRQSLIIGKWDCCMKNETMKNGTVMMGKDEWDQFDKTKVTLLIYNQNCF